MSTKKIVLTKREYIILIGCLNDASGYPYTHFEDGVKENRDKFIKLFDKLLTLKILDKEDLYFAILSLRQSLKQMDAYELLATQDDVDHKEIKKLLEKLEGMK